SVDDDEYVGVCGNDRIRRLADAPHQLGQTLEDLREAHDRKLGEVEQRYEAMGLQCVAADADQFDRPGMGLLQRCNEIAAKEIARHLSGDHGNLQCFRCHHSPPFGRWESMPQTNRPALSAAATTACS